MFCQVRSVFGMTTSESFGTGQGDRHFGIHGHYHTPDS